MRIVSSRSGLVDSKATGQPINSSIRRTYLMASAGSCAQERASGRDRVPALGGLVDRLDPGLGVLAGRKVVDLPAVQTVADADLDLFQRIQNVELGQGDAVDAAGPHGLAHQHGVEPAAAAAAGRSRCRTRGRAGRCRRRSDRPRQFGRERAGADPRGVGLADAEHVADRARARGPSRSPPARPRCWKRSRRDRCRGRCRAARPARPRTGCAGLRGACRRAAATPNP